MNLSVVVSTYNSPRYLKLVLEGLSCQVDRAFDVVIADDGSRTETAEVIAGFAKSLRLTHAWQADRGFRLAASRNNALAHASGDVVAFLDGDCIPEPHYTGDVKRLFEDGGTSIYVQGHRVILSDAVSTAMQSVEGIFETGWIWNHRAQLGNIQNAFRFPWPRRPHMKLRGVRGCNMIFRTRDLLELNGFDEEFVGWGHEDQDMIRRLFRHGVRRVDARGAAVVYHLFHPENDRKEDGGNLERARAERPVVATKGVRGSL